MQEELKVSFIGDAGSIEAASKQSVAALDKVSKASTQSAQTFSKSSAAISQAAKQESTDIGNVAKVSEQTGQQFSKTSAAITQGANNMAKGAATAGGALAKIKPGSDQATQALTNLSRVAQDAPYGFIGIANNINPLLESFQRLKSSTGTTGGALKALGSSLMGAGGLGLAVGVVSSLLVVFGDNIKDLIGGLGDSKRSIEENSLALGQLENELQSVKQDIDNFTSSLEYANKIGKLQIDIGFGKGLKADLIDLRGQSIANLDLTSNLEKQAKKASEIVGKIRDNLIHELSKPGNEKLFDAFDKDLLGSIDDLPPKIQKTFAALQTAEKEQASIGEQLIKSRQNQNVLYAQIEQKKIDIQEDGNKKAKDAEEKAEAERQKALAKSKAAQREALQALKEYQNERAKIIEGFSKDFAELKIFTLPDVGDPKSNKELFDRLHKRLIEEAGRQLPIKIKLPVDVTIEQDFKTGKIDITEKLKEITSGIDPVKVNIPLKPTIVWQGTQLNDQLQDFGKIGNAIGERLGHGFGDVFQKIFEKSMSDAVMKGLSGDALENFKDGLVAVSVITSQAFDGLGDAFGNLTSALLTGKNAMQSFGESLKNTFVQLAAQLAKTIALAAILSLITGGIGAKGGLSFLGAFKKILGFAKGGLVPGTGNGDTVPALLTPGEFVVTKDKAPLAQRLFGNGNTPRSINGIMGYAQGGLVRAIDNSSNSAMGRVEQVPYIAGFDISHDKVRLMINRANNFGNTFGR